MKEIRPQGTHWPTSPHIKEKPYYRSLFAGNKCYKLLEKNHLVQDLIYGYANVHCNTKSENCFFPHQFIDLKHKSLGKFSEQPIEAIHYHFSSNW